MICSDSTLAGRLCGDDSPELAAHRAVLRRLLRR